MTRLDACTTVTAIYCRGSFSDGDCYWEHCPQERNNRANYQSYCPLARIKEHFNRIDCGSEDTRS